jgi:hypothetical protein
MQYCVFLNVYQLIYPSILAHVPVLPLKSTDLQLCARPFTFRIIVCINPFIPIIVNPYCRQYIHPPISPSIHIPISTLVIASIDLSIRPFIHHLINSCRLKDCLTVALPPLPPRYPYPRLVIQ